MKQAIDVDARRGKKGERKRCRKVLREGTVFPTPPCSPGKCGVLSNLEVFSKCADTRVL